MHTIGNERVSEFIQKELTVDSFDLLSGFPENLRARILNKKASRLKFSISLKKLQSRLKFTISTFRIFETIGPWWVAHLNFQISLEIFNPGGRS